MIQMKIYETLGPNRWNVFLLDLIENKWYIRYHSCSFPYKTTKRHGGLVDVNDTRQEMIGYCMLAKKSISLYLLFIFSLIFFLLIYFLSNYWNPITLIKLCERERQIPLVTFHPFNVESMTGQLIWKLTSLRYGMS